MVGRPGYFKVAAKTSGCVIAIARGEDANGVVTRLCSSAGKEEGDGGNIGNNTILQYKLNVRDARSSGGAILYG